MYTLWKVHALELARNFSCGWVRGWQGKRCHPGRAHRLWNKRRVMALYAACRRTPALTGAFRAGTWPSMSLGGACAGARWRWSFSKANTASDRESKNEKQKTHCDKSAFDAEPVT